MVNEIAFRFDFSQFEKRLLHVTLTLTEPAAEDYVLFLPTWIPGSYLIRDFAKHLIQIRVDGDHHLEKISKNRWRLKLAQKKTVHIDYEIYAGDLSVRGAHADSTHIYLNGPSVFLGVEGHTHLPMDVTFPVDHVPHAFSVATALQPRAVDARGFGHYRAKHYDELMDCPVEIGALTKLSFEVANVPHEIAILNMPPCATEQLVQDVQKICNAQTELFQSLPMPHYHFLVHASENLYGGLEHETSSSLSIGRYHFPQPEETERSLAYQQFLGLFSHEYFHSWLVKRIKPQTLMPYRYESENYTRLLWLFEGFTAYYDDLMLLRSKVIQTTQYLTLLAQTMTRYLKTPGRLVQTVSDASFDSWIKYYQPQEHSPNTQVSYYLKGSLVALCLDAQLRLKSQDTISLDDVMALLWQTYGMLEKGVPEDGLYSILETLAPGAGFGKFLDKAIHTTEELPLEECFEILGISMKKTPKLCNGKPVPYLGIQYVEESSHKIQYVFRSSPADVAGLLPGDELIAINGMKCDARNYLQELSFYRANETIICSYFRRGRLFTQVVELKEADWDTITLECQNEENIQRRSNWLNIPIELHP